jgi:predicted O-linked N-acetylglucosamine transferase (SPINDLY family)
LALQQQGRLIEAEYFYESVLRETPKESNALHLLGVLSCQTGRTQRGVELIAKAIKIDPNFAVAHDNLGIGLRTLRRFKDALASHEKAIALNPNYAEAHFNRGNVLGDLGRFNEALASYRQAISLKPNSANFHLGLAVALCNENRRAEGVTQIEQALALKPDFTEAKFALCSAQLPFLYMNEQEIAERRAAYQKCLEALCNEPKISSEWANAIGMNQPFLLAYQGYNDRELQNLYGTLVCRIMAERYPPSTLGRPARSDKLIRLGIVSGFFRQHSNWKIPIKGWLSQIDRRRFHVFGYYTGPIKDAATEQAMALCDRFVQGPLAIDRWRQTILDDGPDVLIYPEVGMDAVTAKLAAQRLAPVQCNSWGHPDTSGFPTLDYYLSSELMEPSESQAHYTERLIQLPNLSIYYEPLDLQPIPISRAKLGLRSAATVYWCGQSLFKYLPQYDHVFPRIAQDVGNCQFVFIQFQLSDNVTSLFQKRLDRAFTAFGLKANDHCVFLRRQEDERWFLGAIGQCDIVLDSIGWSGCNSTLESLHFSLPIVTLSAPLMRGRHSMAVLKMMGVEETITQTVDDYILTAIRLAQDLQWRIAVKNRISENKHRVYRDSTCISALEEFLTKAVGRE